MSREVAWSKGGNPDASVAVLVDADTRGQLLRDRSLVDRLLDRASREGSVDGEALAIEVGSEVDSTIEEGEAFEVVEGLEATVADLAVIEVGSAGEEVSAIKIALVSRMARHLLVHPVDLAREAVSAPAHQTAEAATKTEDATATAATDVEVAVAEEEEVAMTPGILAASAAAIATPLATAEVGTATAIGMPSDLDETRTTGRGSGITRGTSMTIRDRSGGIERQHHIPGQLCWWVSSFNLLRLLPRISPNQGKKVLHYYQINGVQKHQQWHCGGFSRIGTIVHRHLSTGCTNPKSTGIVIPDLMTSFKSCLTRPASFLCGATAFISTWRR